MKQHIFQKVHLFSVMSENKNNKNVDTPLSFQKYQLVEAASRNFNALIKTFDKRSTLAELANFCAAGRDSLDKFMDFFPRSEPKTTDEFVCALCQIKGAFTLIDYVLSAAQTALSNKWIPYIVSDEVMNMYAACSNLVAKYLVLLKTKNWTDGDIYSKKKCNVAEVDVHLAFLRASSEDMMKGARTRSDAWKPVHDICRMAYLADQAHRNAEEGAKSTRRAAARNAAFLAREVLHDMKPTEEEEKHAVCVSTRSIISSFTEGDGFGRIPFADQRIVNRIAMCREIKECAEKALEHLRTVYDYSSYLNIEFVSPK